MSKIKMKTPLVEMDGDEMTRVIWREVKEILLKPFIELKTEYYDLGLNSREQTDDKITADAANAIKKYGVGVKCATITPNEERVKEYGLRKMYKSPNGTIRSILDGTVFRKPILIKGITPLVPSWKKPIIIARHAYGDIYKNVEMRAKRGDIGILADENSEENRNMIIHEFKGSGGIIQGIHNTDESIFSFARSCFFYALSEKKDLWFGTKDTISKIYDRRFRDIFDDIFEREFREKFENENIEYFYTLIDDLIARVMRSKGGFIWACKNYDGDVFSDMVATAFGSLAMMTSVLLSPKGYFEYEAAHGTVQKHYYKYKRGEESSTNSVATIFAWTGALKKRGELDKLPELEKFAKKLEKTVIKTIEAGKMTGDLFLISKIERKEKLETIAFLKEVARSL
ncbi:MAG: NADP-dependent isocitrate dehydrogenase [Clostridiales Family XIII bacterium]|jgi:isocitrate dehydrogenase|nr:NADP-dependent isocitrate dehydrogenase [Clostridiales Family XIII bacterium]